MRTRQTCLLCTWHFVALCHLLGCFELGSTHTLLIMLNLQPLEGLFQRLDSTSCDVLVDLGGDREIAEDSNALLNASFLALGLGDVDVLTVSKVTVYMT